MLCLVGSVFASCSRYAVNFWNQGLHQGASLSLDAEENVADVFYFPLLRRIAGFVLLFLALVLLRHPHRDPRAAAAGADGPGADGMMPDLGKYAVEVLSAYGVTLVLLAGLVVLTLWRGARCGGNWTA